MDHTKMLTLEKRKLRVAVLQHWLDTPHPLRDGQSLEGEILRPLEDEEEQVEYRSQPVELVLVDVCAGAA